MAIFGQFTKRAQQVLMTAQECATREGQPYVGTLHDEEGIIAEADAAAAVFAAPPEGGFEEVHRLRGMSGGVPCAGEGGAQRAWEESEIRLQEVYSVLLLSGDVPSEGDFGVSQPAE